MAPTRKQQIFLRAFGHVVRARREELAISQEQFSFKCGLDRTYISGIENGRRNPTLATILQLAAALEVSLGELISEAQDRLPKKSSS